MRSADASGRTNGNEIPATREVQSASVGRFHATRSPLFYFDFETLSNQEKTILLVTSVVYLDFESEINQKFSSNSNGTFKGHTTYHAKLTLIIYLNVSSHNSFPFHTNLKHGCFETNAAARAARASPYFISFFAR